MRSLFLFPPFRQLYDLISFTNTVPFIAIVLSEFAVTTAKIRRETPTKPTRKDPARVASKEVAPHASNGASDVKINSRNDMKQVIKTAAGGKQSGKRSGLSDGTDESAVTDKDRREDCDGELQDDDATVSIQLRGHTGDFEKKR